MADDPPALEQHHCDVGANFVRIDPLKQMGLAIGRNIVEGHKETFSGENCECGCACFTVRLPRAKDDTAKTACPVADGPIQSNGIMGSSQSVVKV
jgi:hypothetical protein